MSRDWSTPCCADLSLGHDRGLTRRVLLSRSAAAVVVALLSPVDWPEVLLRNARAAGDDLVRDTINGLVAFIVPGRDPYSRAQGVIVDEPGGIGAGATPAVIEVLDFFASDAQGRPVPLSGVVVTLLNSAAQRVNPTGSRGGFLSAFARLSFAEKLEAYHEIDVDPALAAEQGQLALLPTVVGLITYSEAPVLDRATGRLRRTPVGWRMSGYGGPADGRAELRGYYHGRKQSNGR
jgi:hypothetical protein